MSAGATTTPTANRARPDPAHGRLTQSERRARSRGALLESAARGLSRHGYSNLVLEEVAREAGYTRGALYHQFKDKEDLALAVIEWVNENWMREVGDPAARQPTPELRAKHIEAISALPKRFRDAVEGLNKEQLNTPYREGGWTIKQLVHHVPDSHLNAYIRCKLVLTENVPTIKPYNEDAWAKLKDSEVTPVEVSLTLLESIHTRWINLLNSLQADDFQRKLNHPEAGVMTLDRLVNLYDWHGRHHTAHVTALRERMKW